MNKTGRSPKIVLNLQLQIYCVELPAVMTIAALRFDRSSAHPKTPLSAKTYET